MEMSRVTKCKVDDCAYNMNNCCHTIAITIGNSMSPICDTFCQSVMKGGEVSYIAGVGSCKSFSCVYNNNFECGATGISIGYKEQESDCFTFQTM